MALFGAVPWIVFLVGAAGGGDPTLLVLGAVAIVGGGFVALVGVGFVRRLDALRRAADEHRLDAAILATTARAPITADTAAPDTGCGDECTTCTASCALGAVRS